MALSKKYITPLNTSFLTVNQITTSREDLLYKDISQRQTAVPELYQKVWPNVVKDKDSATSASWDHHITLRGFLRCYCCFNYFFIFYFTCTGICLNACLHTTVYLVPSESVSQFQD